MRLILIHGAGLGAWAWERVLPGLEFPSLAVDLPRRGDTTQVLATMSLEDYAQSVVEQIGGPRDEKIVLVGHSVGGEIALRVASRMPGRVAGIVFVSAVLPPPGKSMLSLQPWFQRQFMKPIFRFGPPLPPEKVIRASGCADLDEATCRLLVSRYAPESPRLFLDPVAWAPADLPPCLYVKTLLDRTVLPPIQDLMIARAKPSRVETIESGHLPMLAKPGELAKILNAFAHSLPIV
jgi:pimeloyl-ACP methyl ester carboxylesterase